VYLRCLSKFVSRKRNWSGVNVLHSAMSSPLLAFRHAHCSSAIRNGPFIRSVPLRANYLSKRHPSLQVEAWKDLSNIQEAEQLSLFDVVRTVARQTIPLLLVMLVPIGCAEAYNVRVEDVENPAMQAGVLRLVSSVPLNEYLSGHGWRIAYADVTFPSW
jgi:hypothetical protein